MAVFRVHAECVSIMSFQAFTRVFTALLLSVPLASTFAHAENPEHNDIRTIATKFLQQISSVQPGEVSINVGQVDSRLNLGKCNNPTAFLPQGARAWGKTNVGVRCTSPTAWTVYLQAYVKITADYYVASRNITSGQILSMDDMTKTKGEISSLPYAIITSPEQAIGKSLQVGLTAGGLLRTDLLKNPLVVQQGQSVRIIADGPGFHVATDAQALNNAAEGQVAKARTSSGQTVSGIAKAGGIIEVAY